MLNAVQLMGRIVADPEVKTTNKGGRETVIARYRLAVERDYKIGEKKPVDFISCKAFGPNANYAKEYFRKGDLVVISGQIITETYVKGETGEKQYVTLVQIDRNYLAKKGNSAYSDRGMEPGRDRTGTYDGQPQAAYAEQDYYDEERPPLPYDGPERGFQ